VTASYVELVLDLAVWAGPADADDRLLLGHCVGATLDVGCGPGRLTHRLGADGHVVLGIDVTPEAVAMTVDGGGVALHRDVFAPLPGEGRWDTALLADGNLGIGGDPTALLRRLRDVLAPDGRVVAEVAAPGTWSGTGPARFRAPGGRLSEPVAWAVVSADTVEEHARAAGLGVRLHRVGARWCAVLEAA
jgi:SAM-dependent methyltransferase